MTLLESSVGDTVIHFVIDALMLALSYVVATPLFDPVRPFLWFGLLASLVGSAVAIAIYVKTPQTKKCIKLTDNIAEQASQCVILSNLMVRILVKTVILNVLILLVVYTANLWVLLLSELLNFFVLRKLILSEVVVADEICCIGGKLYAEACDIRGRVVKIYKMALIAVTPLSKITYIIPSGKERIVHDFIRRECRDDPRLSGYFVASSDSNSSS